MRSGAGLLTITGEVAGSLPSSLVSDGILISDGMLNTVEGCEAAVCAGWLLEFIRYTPPKAAAPTTASPAIISRPLLAVPDCATGAICCTGICCIGIGCWGIGA